MSEVLNAVQIKAEAARLGFSACGLSPARPVDEACSAAYLNWISAGRSAEMVYLSNNMDKRLNPCLLVDGAQTVVSVALNYYTETPLSPEGYGFARYALGRDYHDVVREKLRQLMAALGLEEHVDGRVFCDTAPVLERYWAVRCGIGWCGRNGQLIVPGVGSYCFLGELILTRKADSYDTSVNARCGTCRKCVDACPSGALSGDGTLDARRCLSYLTIEHRGELPDEAQHVMGRCIYGCDRCAEVCPWNNSAVPAVEKAFEPSEALCLMRSTDWQRLTEEQYRQLFKGSAVKRAKYDGLLRNIAAVRKQEGVEGQE